MIKAKVLGTTPLSSTASGVTLLLADGANFKFYPGQYISLSFKRRGRQAPWRSFSIVSAPHELPRLQFAMRISGDYTAAVAELEAGDEVSIQGPFGNFVYDPSFDKDTILLAGGIGITPFISFLRDAAANPTPHSLTLLYAVRSPQDMPFAAELADLQKQNPRLKVYAFSDKTTANTTDTHGIIPRRIDVQTLQKITGGRNNAFTYYICGPGSFMSGMNDMLNGLGVQPQRIISESFMLGGAAKEVPEKQLTRRVYALVGASLLAALAVVGVKDLHGYSEKLAALSATNTEMSDTAAAEQDDETISQTTVTPTTDNSTSNTNSTSTTPTPITTPKTVTPTQAPTTVTPTPTVTRRSARTSVS